MNKLFDMSGKIALVTGGAGLLGKKHAEAIIEQGGEVILADYDLEAAVSAAKELGNLAHAEYINVLDKESIHKVVKKYEKRAKYNKGGHQGDAECKTNNIFCCQMGCYRHDKVPCNLFCKKKYKSELPKSRRRFC